MTSIRPRPDGGLTVSALAKQVGIGPDTVRYYERAGLLPAPRRTPSAYRVYGESDVDRLRFIQGAQRLGLRLREIKTLLEVRDTGHCPCEPAEQLLRAHLAEIDREIRRLRALRREVVAMADRLPSANCPDPLPGTWRANELKGGDGNASTELDLPVLR